MKKKVVAQIGPVAAVVVCAVGAWAVTLVHWKPPAQELVPFAFLAIVFALGMLFGRTVGILGSIIAALVFAHSMYQPVGSFRVTDQSARSGLAWMLLAGVSLSYLLLPSGGMGSDQKNRRV